jgi:hypothetical protein
MSSQRGLIAARAYELWKLRGNPEGSPDVDWYQAEKEILGRADDPAKPKATLDSLQQVAADALTSESDRGPTDSDTEETSPDGSTSKPAQPRRNGGGRSRANGH